MKDRRLLDVLGVTSLAALLRFFHLLEIRANDPFFSSPSVDGRVYHDWALAIAAGDWLGEGVLNLSPLYPYGLGALYSVIGPSFLAVKLLQLGFGALAAGGLTALGQRLFDRRTGLIAGCGLALYPMAILYEGTHLIAAIQLPLAVGLLIVACWNARRPSIVSGLALGLMIGVAALARPTALLAAPLLAAGLVVAPMRGDRRMGFVSACAICIGLVVAIAPVTLRNRVVGGEWVVVSANSGINLYLGNHAAADGTFFRIPKDFPVTQFDNPIEQRETSRRVAEERLGRALAASEVSDYWRDRALEDILEDPVRWLRLEFRKMGLFANAHEVWNNRSLELSRQFSWVLRLPLPGFGVLAPFGILGMLMLVPRARAFWPLYVSVLIHLAAALVFFVLARYRLPAIPALLLFAASAITRLWDLGREKQWRSLAATGAVVVALAFVAHLPLASSPLHMAYFNLGNRYRAHEQWDQAAAQYWKALHIAQRHMPSFDALARTFEDLGKKEEAVRTWRYLHALATERGARSYAARAERHLEELGETVDPTPTGGDGEDAP